MQRAQHTWKGTFFCLCQSRSCHAEYSSVCLKSDAPFDAPGAYSDLLWRRSSHKELFKLTASNRINRACQDPWWCNTTQLLYEYTYCVQLKSYLSLCTLRKRGSVQGSVLRKLFWSRLICLPSQGQDSQTCILMMKMIGHPVHWICPRASGNQCGEENKLAWQNVWQLEAIKAQIRPQTLDPHPPSKNYLCKSSKKHKGNSGRSLLFSSDKHGKQSPNICSSLPCQ